MEISHGNNACPFEKYPTEINGPCSWNRCYVKSIEFETIFNLKGYISRRTDILHGCGKIIPPKSLLRARSFPPFSLVEAKFLFRYFFILSSASFEASCGDDSYRARMNHTLGKVPPVCRDGRDTRR